MRQLIVLFALLLVTCTNAFVVQREDTKKSLSALEMTKLTYGDKAKDFKPGSKLSAACSALGVKPRYNCKK